MPHKHTVMSTSKPSTPPAAEGTCRTAARARRLRRRVRGPHQGAGVARRREAGAARPHEPGAPRRVRLRRECRRRRGRAHSDARPVPEKGHRSARHHAAAGRPLRRGPGVSAAGRRGARGSSNSSSSGSRARGRPGGPRLAHPAGGRPRARRLRARGPARGRSSCGLRIFISDDPIAGFREFHCRIPELKERTRTCASSARST